LKLRQQISINLKYILKNIPLPGGRRNPTRLIQGISSTCGKCDTIMYDKYINESGCIKCNKLTKNTLNKHCLCSLY